MRILSKSRFVMIAFHDPNLSSFAGGKRIRVTVTSLKIRKMLCGVMGTSEIISFLQETYVKVLVLKKLLH